MLSQAQTKIGGAAGAPNKDAFLQLGDAGASKGLLLPRVALTATNSFAPLSAHVEGMHVYNTATASAGATAVTPGEYYNDGTQWIRLITTAPSLNITGNGAPNAANAPNPVKGMIYTDVDGGNFDVIPAVPASPTFGQQWTYSGSAWIQYLVPNSTAWYLKGTTNDAGADKGAAISRRNSVEIKTDGRLFPSYSISAFGGVTPNFSMMSAGGTEAAPAFTNQNLGALIGRSIRIPTAESSIYFSREGMESAASAPTNIIFNTTAPGTVQFAEKMRIGGNGNVGIGTTVPLTKLHVLGTGGTTILLESSATAKAEFYTTSADGANASRYLTFSAAHSSGMAGNFLGGWFSFDSVNNTRIQTGTALLVASENHGPNNHGTEMHFSTTPNNSGNTQAVDRLIITNAGNVGIGTPSPAAKLEVNNGTTAGAIKIVDGTQGAGKVLTSDANGLATWATPTSLNTSEWYLSGGTTDAGGNKTSNIYRNGNLGIGTSTPNAPLQFANTTANRKIVLFDNNNNDHQFYGIGIQGGGLFRSQVDAAGASFGWFAGASATTSNELMRLTGTGNLGIGTNTPNAPLQFGNGQANRKIVFYDANNNDHQFIGMGIGNALFRSQVDGTGTSFGWYAATSATTSDELMRLTGTGNLGIGTTAPAAKLDVNGDIRSASGIFRSGQRTNCYLRLQSDGNLGLWDNGAVYWSAGVTASDIRVKTDIKTAPSMLERVNKLQIIDYKYKKELNDNDKQRVGVIAQDVIKLFPEYQADLIYHDENADRYIVHYDKLSVLLIKSVQEQQSQIDELKKAVAELKASK